MALINKLKDTGESYEQFLARVRGAEAAARDFLPENKHIAKEVKMADAYDKTLKDVKSRSFAELDPTTPYGLKELISLQNEGVSVVRYIKIGTPLELVVCEDAGVYWFDEVTE